MSLVENNQSTASKSKQTKNYNSKPCFNKECTLNNGVLGSWRTDKGQKGGGKGWCKDCLKKDEKILRDAGGHETYTCQ